MGKQVRISLGADGSIKTEASGFVGGSCKEATAFLERLFGDPETEELKQSFYEAEEETKICDGLPSGWCG